MIGFLFISNHHFYNEKTEWFEESAVASTDRRDRDMRQITIFDSIAQVNTIHGRYLQKFQIFPFYERNSNELKYIFSIVPREIKG